MRKAAFEKVFELAKSDPRTYLVVSDIGASAVDRFLKELPDQLIVEGIAEGHLVGMASGLAERDNVVFINTIASFLSRRAFDQIAINVCLENANVKLLSQGGGILYSTLGPTHHANEDIALMRTLPGMTVIVPCDTEQTRAAVDYAYAHPGPFYIRLAKGASRVVSRGFPLDPTQPLVLKKPQTTALITTGTMTQVALQAAEGLPLCGVISIPFLKPFPHRELAKLLEGIENILIVEEHVRNGGLSSCVFETLVCHLQRPIRTKALTLPDQFIRVYGQHDDLLKIHGLDVDSIKTELEGFTRSPANHLQPNQK